MLSGGLLSFTVPEVVPMKLLFWLARVIWSFLTELKFFFVAVGATPKAVLGLFPVTEGFLVSFVIWT